jgi:hypothetical protein
MLNVVANRNLTEREILSRISESGTSIEFFQVTNNQGVFADIDFCGGTQEELATVQAQIDKILEGYGIPFAPWEETPIEGWVYHPGDRYVRSSNGIIHFDQMIPGNRPWWNA